jgi:hypothetical protein
VIKVSSGKPIATDKQGNRIFGNSKVHTVLLLLLLCRPECDAEPDEMSSPWQDRPEVRSGKKSKSEYVREIAEGIDLVPPDILELVIGELLDSGREVKPSLSELKSLCESALRVQEEAEHLRARARSRSKPRTTGRIVFRRGN